MGAPEEFSAAGGCTCRAVRYELRRVPLIVHCCHCRWCQRETGAAFALNAMIEADRVELLSGQPEPVMTPSAMPPDIHIFTSTKQPWVVLPEGAKAVPEFYRPRETWPKESQDRFAALKAK